MFYHIPDGSKVALVKLVQHLQARGFHSISVAQSVASFRVSPLP
ncbi:MAG: hypothetical protein Q6L68_09290 [Thermostichus sp. DG02_5_bins_236]